MRFPVISVLLLLLSYESVGAREWHKRKLFHQPRSITSDDLTFLSGLSNETLFNQTLSKIAIPRVVGTKAHDAVKNFIEKSMKQLGWDIHIDAFSQDTIIGNKFFENIIATLDPNASRHLVLACHYDSKMDREKALVLATDSAVPCSMMINLAQLLQPYLKNHAASNNEVTLQFIFFDGEEAFRDWTSTDSIYGARHLAHKLSSSSYPEANSQGTTHLHRMDVMVLLDLLGASQPAFRNFFQDTSNLYLNIQNIEKDLNKLGLISTASDPYFKGDRAWSGVEDDHIPFLHKGVHILHIIPTPFPSVWHKETDTVDNLDFPTIDNLNKIFRCFVASYLHLNLSESIA